MESRIAHGVMALSLRNEKIWLQKASLCGGKEADKVKGDAVQRAFPLS